MKPQSPWPSGRASVSGAEDRGFESLRGCFCSMLIAAYAARKLLGAVTKASITRTVPVAQWLRRVTTNHEIGGSSPSRNAF